MSNLSAIEKDLLESEKANESSRLAIQEEEKASSEDEGVAAGKLKAGKAIAM
jgi:hypothetical protein